MKDATPSSRKLGCSGRETGSIRFELVFCLPPRVREHGVSTMRNNGAPGDEAEMFVQIAGSFQNEPDHRQEGKHHDHLVAVAPLLVRLRLCRARCCGGLCGVAVFPDPAGRQGHRRPGDRSRLSRRGGRALGRGRERRHLQPRVRGAGHPPARRHGLSGGCGWRRCGRPRGAHRPVRPFHAPCAERREVPALLEVRGLRRCVHAVAVSRRARAAVPEHPARAARPPGRPRRELRQGALRRRLADAHAGAVRRHQQLCRRAPARRAQPAAGRGPGQQPGGVPAAVPAPQRTRHARGRDREGRVGAARAAGHVCPEPARRAPAPRAAEHAATPACDHAAGCRRPARSGRSARSDRAPRRRHPRP